jgi:NRPS condensation-like uncharacterized protein
VSAPYANIGDVNENSACFTDSNGHDVAWLTRVMRSDVPPTATTLTDDQWQQTINLINVAPQLLESLEAAVRSANADEYETCWYATARRAISKAKGNL